jgi:hypothetical protein
MKETAEFERETVLKEVREKFVDAETLGVGYGSRKVCCKWMTMECVVL